MAGEQSDSPDRTAVPDNEIRDELPQDLDITAIEEPYVFPNNNRRKVPGYLYLFIAAACLAAWLFLRTEDSVLINGGMLFAAVVLGVFGAFHLIAGWNLDVDEEQALVEATKAVGFPIGHASAQMGWRGYLSRPTWRVLCYSADSPPSMRGLVLVDGVNGEVVDQIVERNPEDWSEFVDLTDG
jgi:hypothetical protein